MSTPTGDRPLRVLVVDDQSLMRSGFTMILDSEEDLEVVGEAADGAAAVDEARRLRPDVVLMDVQMPGVDGIEATRRIVAEDLSKVLILTTFDRDDYLFDGLRAGAGGFLLKNADADDLADAVRAVAHGHALLAPEVTMRVIARLTAEGDGDTTGATTATTAPAASAVPSTSPAGPAPGVEHLTARETEVLRLVARGLSNAEIAGELFVGEATVKTHVSSCLAKLHLRDRVQAVVFAHEHGLVAPPPG